MLKRNFDVALKLGKPYGYKFFVIEKSLTDCNPSKGIKKTKTFKAYFERLFVMDKILQHII